MQDEGGVTKEFFQILVHDLFNENYGMFIHRSQSRTFWFNMLAQGMESEFELVGIVIGLAIYNGVILDVHFPLVVYKKLLNQDLTLAVSPDSCCPWTAGDCCCILSSQHFLIIAAETTWCAYASPGEQSNCTCSRFCWTASPTYARLPAACCSTRAPCQGHQFCPGHQAFFCATTMLEVFELQRCYPGPEWMTRAGDFLLYHGAGPKLHGNMGAGLEASGPRGWKVHAADP